MPEDYKRGERIRVTIDGDVTAVGQENGDTLLSLVYKLPEGADAHGAVFTDAGAVTITRLIPAEGEPQRGDVWRDKDGTDWFAHRGRYDSQVYLMSAESEGEIWTAINRERGPLSRIYHQPAAPVERAVEVRVGDVWRDRDSDEWLVADFTDGTFFLRLDNVLDGSRRSWGWVSGGCGPLTLVSRGPIEQLPVGTPGEDTVPIGGVSPKSFVVHPDWNDGKLVGISTVEDSETYPGMTFVAYTDVRRPGSAAVMVDVDPDMQVTPWNFGDAL